MLIFTIWNGWFQWTLGRLGVARTGATDTKRAGVIIENDVKAFHQNIFKINPVKEGLTMHAVNYIFFRTLSTIVNFMFYFDGKRRTGSDRAHWAVWSQSQSSIQVT